MFERKMKRLEGKIEKIGRQIKECDETIEALKKGVRVNAYEPEQIEECLENIISAGKIKCELIEEKYRLSNKLKIFKIIELII